MGRACPLSPDSVDVTNSCALRTGDTDFIKSYWPQISAIMGYIAQTSIDPTTYFGTNGGSGANIYSTCLMVDTLEQVVEMGQSLGYNSSIMTQYALQAQLSRQAVEHTWNATGGYFAMPGSDFAVADISAVERTKIGTPEQRAKFWSLLPSRAEPGGFVDPPAGANKFDLLGGGVKISMNVAGELLWGLGEYRDGKTAADLLMRTYAVQADSASRNYTGGYWEFLVGRVARHVQQEDFTDAEPFSRALTELTPETTSRPPSRTTGAASRLHS